MADPLSVLSAFAKTSDTLDDQIRAKGLKDLGWMLLSSAGAGVGGRSAVGLYNMLRRRVAPPQAAYPSAIVSQIPYPVPDDSKKSAGAAASAAPPAPASHLTNKTDLPWYWPGLVGAGALGVYGGWKGMDYLLNRRRKGDEEQELADAKSEFNKAMLNSYEQPKTAGEKTAGAELGAVLDALYDGHVKNAAAKSAAAWPSLGEMEGAYGAYAGGTGLLAGVLAYDSARKGNREATLQKAMKQRQRRAYMARPSEIIAEPAPVASSVIPAGLEPDSDDTIDAG